MRSRISFGIGRSSKLRTIFRLRTTSWNSTSYPPVAIALSFPMLHAATIGAMSRPEVPLRSRLPDRVTIVEVAPRDGLQAELTTVPTEAKLEFIERLIAAGHTVVEATSFVSPEAVPQLADADALLRRLRKTPGVRYPVLVPNARGLERALEAGVSEVAVFLSASESYSQKNLRRPRAEAL